jgi:ferredoxin-type protein NapH
MMSKLLKNRYLILRRIVQLSILALYFGANAYGWKVLVGNLNYSKFLQVIPLSDPFTVLEMLAAGVVVGADILIGVAVVVIFYGLIGGRAFCSWVCPINMVTDLANWLRRKLGIDRDARRINISRNFRYWALGTMLVVSFVVGAAAYEFVNPIGFFGRGLLFSIGFGWTLILAIFLFDLLILKHGWCGYICPVGATYSIIGSKSLIRVEHNHLNCTNCGKCKEVCPEKQVLNPIIYRKSDFIEGKECTNCGRCIEVCNDNALKFSIRSFVKNN